ncbi:MAG: hypothetical protein J6W81_07415 [Lentisphaeria bacterium]|nr:hypothetical protein [Lentisphaeria bacterium]
MAKIQILGSAAAEGIPAAFCNCRVCTEAWKNGGKDIRMRTAYKLNDQVRIDFGPDSLAQEYKYQLHSERLKHLFITHSHEDHFYLDLLNYRMPGFSVVEEDNILNIYGNPGVIRAIQRFFWEKSYDRFNGDYKKFRLNPVTLEPFQPVVLEDQDMEFYPVKADHMIGVGTEIPMCYIFRIGSSWGMIANDSGYFREETWAFLEKRKFKLDLMINDCTGGLLDIERGHMSGKYVLDTKARLEKIGSVTAETQYYINHFSHNGQATHTELEAKFNPYGIQVAYDGLEIEF